jgi:hypothetical protein
MTEPTKYWPCDCGNGVAEGDETLAQDGALRCRCGRPLSGDPEPRMTSPTNPVDDIERVARAITAKRTEILGKRLGIVDGLDWDDYTDEGKADAMEEARAAIAALTNK